MSALLAVYLRLVQLVPAWLVVTGEPWRSALLTVYVAGLFCLFTLWQELRDARV